MKNGSEMLFLHFYTICTYSFKTLRKRCKLNAVGYVLSKTFEGLCFIILRAKSSRVLSKSTINLLHISLCQRPHNPRGGASGEAASCHPREGERRSR